MRIAVFVLHALLISPNLFAAELSELVDKLTTELLFPVANDLAPNDDRNAFELSNLEINGTVSFKLLEWLSLDYVLRLVRVPQLLDEFQLQNNLLLTASWSLFQPEKDQG